MFKTAKSNWSSTVLVCKKCSKKVDGGFGPDGKTSLVKALRLIFGKGRKASAGVVPVDCFGLCPKNAVVVVSSQRPDKWLIVPARTAVEDVARALNQ